MAPARRQRKRKAEDVFVDELASDEPDFPAKKAAVGRWKPKGQHAIEENGVDSGREESRNFIYYANVQAEKQRGRKQRSNNSLRQFQATLKSKNAEASEEISSIKGDFVRGKKMQMASSPSLAWDQGEDSSVVSQKLRGCSEAILSQTFRMLALHDEMIGSAQVQQPRRHGQKWVEDKRRVEDMLESARLRGLGLVESSLMADRTAATQSVDYPPTGGKEQYLGGIFGRVMSKLAQGTWGETAEGQLITLSTVAASLEG